MGCMEPLERAGLVSRGRDVDGRARSRASRSRRLPNGSRRREFWEGSFQRGDGSPGNAALDGDGDERSQPASATAATMDSDRRL